MERGSVRPNLLLMLAFDASLVIASFYSAYLIRFEFFIPNSEFETFSLTLPLVLLVKVGTFSLFGLYRGMWRYTSLVDMMNVAKAVFTSSSLIIVGVLMGHGFHGYPRSVFLIDGVLTFCTISGIRVVIRLCFAHDTGLELFPSFKKQALGKKRLLIIGAGDAGEKVLREIRDNPGLKFEPIGFLDDDQGKRGKGIHGVPVLGRIKEIEHIGIDFDEILIAIPSARGSEMKRIVCVCDKTGKHYRTVPGIGELISGRVSIKTIREVTIEDLLGREEVRLDQEKIAGYLNQKRVLVTGGGGSIGSELVRQICRFAPKYQPQC